MSASLLNSLMNAQSQTIIPAGQQMQVVMIPSRNIIPNRTMTRSIPSATWMA